MNRRGFITAILAAPLAAVGIFAGNHTKEGAWVEMIAGRMAGPDAFAKFKGPVAIWTMPSKYKVQWVLIEFGDGRITRHEVYPGKSMKLPFVHLKRELWDGSILDSEIDRLGV